MDYLGGSDSPARGFDEVWVLTVRLWLKKNRSYERVSVQKCLEACFVCSEGKREPGVGIGDIYAVWQSLDRTGMKPLRIKKLFVVDDVRHRSLHDLIYL